MDNDKLLIGNSGDKVYLQDDKVIKKAGPHKEKFKTQLDFLLTCNHSNFIDIIKISDEEYHMKKHPTFYNYILNNNLKDSLYKFEDLLNIIDNFETSEHKVEANSYFDKLKDRTGYTYTGDFNAISSYGFIHGDLTISNILYDDKFIFIDPRGTKEQNYYDYGKLMQSFVMKYESHIYNDWNNNYINFCNEAKHIMYDRYDKDQLNFFLAVHLLGAVSFFEMNNRYNLAKLFLTKGHLIFKKLGIKYYK